MLSVLLAIVVVVVVGTQVRHDIVADFVQVFNLVVLLPYMRSSHGS